MVEYAIAQRRVSQQQAAAQLGIGTGFGRTVWHAPKITLKPATAKPDFTKTNTNTREKSRGGETGSPPRGIAEVASAALRSGQGVLAGR